MKCNIILIGIIMEQFQYPGIIVWGSSDSETGNEMRNEMRNNEMKPHPSHSPVCKPYHRATVQCRPVKENRHLLTVCA